MTVAAKKETKGFETEVKQLLHLVIHSLYSNKEIFLRELISNASDAADKLRFAAISNNELFENDADLKIWVDIDKDAATITIRDNGIGMTRDEVVQNLGTIAKSGTREFLESLTGDSKKDAQLIGQFGVGFYSSFIVADTVTVKTRKAGIAASEGVYWQAKGEGEYDIDSIDKAQRGTEITLHLKPEEKEFLESYRLRSMITKYSDHINIPVIMQKEIVEEAEEGQEDKEKTVSYEDEVVNRATALWRLPKSEIKADDYKELYKSISHDFDDPLAWSHNKVEGKHEYVSLLYLPKRAPFDLYQASKMHGLKLYVQRVFIMDDAEQFLPHYLRFVRGIIDSNDLPLNVSREILQGSKVVDSIRNATIKRVLSLLEDMANNKAEDYQQFWAEFGPVLKEGPAEDFANKDTIAKLLRFASTKGDANKQIVSLEDYCARMKVGQDKIYYCAADSFNAASNSPHLEIFRKKDVEVLLLHERIDEWLMSHLTEFDGKSLQSVARGSLELDDLGDKADEKEQKAQEEEFSDIVEKMQKVLEAKVQEVRVSHRLTDSPSCIVVAENAMSPQMERMFKAAGQNVPNSQPILEINPAHPLLQRLKEKANEQQFADMTFLLFEQAVLAEGGQLEDPASFVKRFNQMLLS